MAKRQKPSKKNTQYKIERLTDLAKGELLNHGITNFNYEKVIYDAKLSKSTVYKKLGKKDEFIIFVIKNLLDDFFIPFKKYVDDFNTFQEVLDYLSNLNFDVQTLMKEYPIDDLFEHPEITSIINDYYYQRFGKVITDKIAEFQNSGQIRKDIEAKYILEFLTSVTKGMGLMLKDHDFKEVINNYRKLIETALAYKTNSEKE